MDGIDWGKLVDLAAPIAGAVAVHGQPGGDAGFLQGLAQGRELARQHQLQNQNITTARNQQAGDYLLKIGEHAQSFDDPVELAQFSKLAEEAGVKAGFLKPGDLAGKFSVAPSKLAHKRLTQLTDQLDALDKAGYNLDDLATSGAHVRLQDGTDVPVATALDLTNRRPVDATGQRIARTDKVGNTEEERFLAKRAKDYGYKSLDQVDADTQLQWRQDFRGAGQKPPNQGGVDAQFGDLLDLWKQGHPGQEPPANVRVQLRKQANEVNDKPNALAGAPSALDDSGIDYAATQYRVTGVMPALGMGNGAARAAIINRAAKQAKDLGQTPAAAIQRQYAMKADSDALRKMTTMSASAEAFENKADAQVDIIRNLSQKVDRTQFPVINDAIVNGKINLLGDKNAQLLANAIQTFSAEYAKIIEGSTGSAAGSSDSARRASDRLISAKLNKGTLDATLDLMQREMALTRDGYAATIDHITKRMGGPPSATTPTTAAPPLQIGGFTVRVK